MYENFNQKINNKMLSIMTTLVMKYGKLGYILGMIPLVALTCVFMWGVGALALMPFGIELGIFGKIMLGLGLCQVIAQIKERIHK